MEMVSEMDKRSFDNFSFGDAEAANENESANESASQSDDGGLPDFLKDGSIEEDEEEPAPMLLMGSFVHWFEQLTQSSSLSSSISDMSMSPSISDEGSEDSFYGGHQETRGDDLIMSDDGNDEHANYPNSSWTGGALEFLDDASSNGSLDSGAAFVYGKGNVIAFNDDRAAEYAAFEAETTALMREMEDIL
jgi:hypothetical protein